MRAAKIVTVSEANQLCQCHCKLQKKSVNPENTENAEDTVNPELTENPENTVNPELTENPENTVNPERMKIQKILQIQQKHREQK